MNKFDRIFMYLLAFVVYIGLAGIYPIGSIWFLVFIAVAVFLIGLAVWVYSSSANIKEKEKEKEIVNPGPISLNRLSEMDEIDLRKEAKKYGIDTARMDTYNLMCYLRPPVFMLREDAERRFGELYRIFNGYNSYAHWVGGPIINGKPSLKLRLEEIEKRLGIEWTHVKTDEWKPENPNKDKDE